MYKTIGMAVFVIMLVTGGGVIGVSLAPPNVEIVEVVKYVDIIEYVEKPVYIDRIEYIDRVEYIDNYDSGYNAGWNDMVEKYNKDMEIVKKEVESYWVEFINNRDSEWVIITQNAYNAGWNDASYQTVTDLADILGTLVIFL